MLRPLPRLPAKAVRQSLRSAAWPPRTPHLQCLHCHPAPQLGERLGAWARVIEENLWRMLNGELQTSPLEIPSRVGRARDPTH